MGWVSDVEGVYRLYVHRRFSCHDPLCYDRAELVDFSRGEDSFSMLMILLFDFLNLLNANAHRPSPPQGRWHLASLMWQWLSDPVWKIVIEGARWTYWSASC